jgi:hypothetical protein
MDHISAAKHSVRHGERMWPYVGNNNGGYKGGGAGSTLSVDFVFLHLHE